MIFTKRPSRQTNPSQASVTASIPVSSKMSDNVNMVFRQFHHSQDLLNHPFTINNKAYTAIYFETLIDRDKLELKLFTPAAESSGGLKSFSLEYFQKTSQIGDITQKLLEGFSVIFADGEGTAFLIDTASSFDRSAEEPGNEKVVRGSHQGFVENIAINLNLLRKRINDPNLLVEYSNLGNVTHTKIAIAYIKGIANEELVQKVQARINSIDSDMVFSPGYFEEFIEDSTFSPFPQMLNTERPDRVEANLVEGRVAIFVNGTPTVLVVPVTFFAFYQSPDDYNSRAFIATFIRVIRLCSFLLAILLPAFYIAVIGFHFEVLPVSLLLTVKGAVEKVPYPPLIEALIMELTIELIREAGIRLPSAIGPTIGIVGGLVIGDAIVKAGLVSNTMIVIVATTAIASYVVPSNEMSGAVRLLRFPIMIAAATMGFIGIVFCLMALIIHLCTLESFGTPYFAPVAPFRWRDLKDSIIRAPIWLLKNRPLDPHPEKMKQQSESRKWKRNE